MIVLDHIKRLVECISYDYSQQLLTDRSNVEKVSRSIGRNI
jgi:hypothetical protein